MKRRPSRKEFSAAISPALRRALDSMGEFEQDGQTLVRAMRAVLHAMYDLGEAGRCPAAIAVAVMQHVSAQRLPRLMSKEPAANMPGAKA